MALDAYGVAASLLPLCPLDGVAGPYPVAGQSIYPDGNLTYWRLDFGGSSSSTQQQSAIAALSALSSYVPPQNSSLTPYRISGSATFAAVLALGLITVSANVPGLLKSDTPMIAFGSALPASIDVRAIYPDPSKDGFLILQVAILSALANPATVPFTLIGVR